MDFPAPAAEAQEELFCPFCPLHEATTPPEIWAQREGTWPNTPGWKVRVVPNKFPALRIEGELDRTGVGVYDRMAGIGAHEVIIEGPAHDVHFADHPPEHLELILRTYQSRVRDLSGDPRFRYILLFKNHGAAAGASLRHPHSQLIATPVTPRTVAIELESMREHYVAKERCLVCDILREELGRGDRVVAADDEFVTLAPYASRFPYELFITPRRHAHDFLVCDGPLLASLARTLKGAFTRLRTALSDPPFNFVFHIAPSVALQPQRPGYWQTLPWDFHWHIEIIPRLTRMAGFEWGTGFYINPTAPEEAAGHLRAVAVDQAP
jgi:UDPglucose--hexose-1-phosphate uridylyltransferase